MLTKRKDLMSSKTRAVKNVSLALAVMASAFSASLTTAAQAGEPAFFDRVITHKFSAAELSTDAGVKKVYKKLEQKAKKACIADSFSLNYFGESMTECVDDLVNQFVVSASIDSLSAYHTEKTSAAPKKYASNEG